MESYWHAMLGRIIIIISTDHNNGIVRMMVIIIAIKIINEMSNEEQWEIERYIRIEMRRKQHMMQLVAQ